MFLDAVQLRDYRVLHSACNLLANLFGFLLLALYRTRVPMFLTPSVSSFYDLLHICVRVKFLVAYNLFIWVSFLKFWTFQSFCTGGDWRVWPKKLFRTKKGFKSKTCTADSQRALILFLIQFKRKSKRNVHRHCLVCISLGWFENSLIHIDVSFLFLNACSH